MPWWLSAKKVSVASGRWTAACELIKPFSTATGYAARASPGAAIPAAQSAASLARTRPVYGWVSFSKYLNARVCSCSKSGGSGCLIDGEGTVESKWAADWSDHRKTSLCLHHRPAKLGRRRGLLAMGGEEV